MNVTDTQGLYFDGVSARPVRVSVRLSGDTLCLSGLAFSREWNVHDVNPHDDGGPIVRLGPAGTPECIEIPNDAFAAAFRDRGCRRRSGDDRKGNVTRIVGLSSVMLALVTGFVVWGLPLVADRLALMLPASVEARLGNLAERQLDLTIGKGEPCHSPLAQAAIERLVVKLAPDLSPVPRVIIRSSSLANAVALPDGRIVVLSRLVAEARTPDEFAGVLAHELGHIAKHDPSRVMIHDVGGIFLLSYVMGDVMGATSTVDLGRVLLTASYSREAENAADHYAVAAVSRGSGDGAAFASLLTRIDSKSETTPALLRTHPYIRDRVASIRQLAAEAAHPRRRGPLLDPLSWVAIKAACSPIEAL